MWPLEVWSARRNKLPVRDTVTYLSKKGINSFVARVGARPTCSMLVEFWPKNYHSSIQEVGGKRPWAQKMPAGSFCGKVRDCLVQRRWPAAGDLFWGLLYSSVRTGWLVIGWVNGAVCERWTVRGGGGGRHVGGEGDTNEVNILTSVDTINFFEQRQVCSNSL